ncbi:hypothetical protein [Burkholderia stagnalis]|uniref:hypothetical protein n=1 Tax=Burkholderia stagnalis TaxID=1503054 RepID=UPI000F57AE4A|nr:hypothetical protein [Burkholderia stagnalis]RQQ45102.1 hypothetical protein DF158_35500 [Burkholderia stagnalis]RQR00497.1 hypothetical protein DF025_36020 [Burkholderia stagnalis]RQR00762.1 hypothetical protein DF021_35240 [Burkholderia stagnalis]RQR09482.1 hypothetical protein DF026_36340 [Burkholderia stagnalis]
MKMTKESEEKRDWHDSLTSRLSGIEDAAEEPTLPTSGRGFRGLGGAQRVLLPIPTSAPTGISRLPASSSPPIRLHVPPAALVKQPRPLVHPSFEMVRTPRPVEMAANDATILSVLRQLAEQVVWEVAQQMLGHVLTPEYQKLYVAMRTLHANLRAIYAGNDTTKHKVRKLATVVSAHSQALPEPIDAKVRPYLQSTVDWLEEMVNSWETIELELEHVNNEATLLGKLTSILNATTKMLENQAVSALLGTTAAARIRQSVAPVQILLNQIYGLQHQPGGLQWHDVLTLLVGQERYLPTWLHSILGVAERLVRIEGVRPYAATATPIEKLTWLMDVLSDPSVLHKAEPLLGRETVQFLAQAFGTGQHALQFPGDAGLHAQTLWLFELISRIPRIGGTTATMFLNGLRKAIGDDEESRALFELLMQLANPDASRLDLAIEISKQMAGQLTRQISLASVFDFLKDWIPVPDVIRTTMEMVSQFIHGVKPDEKWTTAAERLRKMVISAAPEMVVNAMSTDPVSLATIQLAKAIGAHKSFEESVEYLVSEVKGKDRMVQMLYWQYLIGMLCWKSYQAFQVEDLSAREATLRELARTLKEADLVTTFPYLEKLIDLIPLIPALQELRQVMAASGGQTTSWLAWGDSVVGAISSSRSPALQALSSTLSQQVTQWLAQGLTSGLMSLGSATGSALTAYTSSATAPKNEAGAGQIAAGGTLPPGASEQSATDTWKGRRPLSIDESEPPASIGSGWGLGVDAGLVDHTRTNYPNQTPLEERPRLDLPADAEDEANEPAADDWDLNALVIDAPEEDVGDKSGFWRTVGNAGAGVSVGIGLLAAAVAVWRWRQARQYEASCGAGQPSSTEDPLLDDPASQDPDLGTVPSEHVQLREPGERTPSPYRHDDLVESISRPHRSTLECYGLPLAAATFGVAIPGAIWWALSSTSVSAIEELSDEEIEKVIQDKLKWTAEIKGRDRKKRSSASDAEFTTTQTIGTTSTQRAFIGHFVRKMSSANQASARTWLQDTVRAIRQRETEGQRRQTVLDLIIVVDVALATWFANHTSDSAPAVGQDVMRELREHLRAELIIESEHPLVRKYLKAIGALPGPGDIRKKQIAAAIEYLNSGKILLDNAHDDYLNTIDEEIANIPEGSRATDADATFHRLLSGRIRSIEGKTPEAIKLNNLLSRLPSLDNRSTQAQTTVSTTHFKPTRKPISSLEELKARFNPISQSPMDYISDWITFKMRLHNMNRVYQGDKIKVTWHTAPPRSRNIINPDANKRGTSHEEYWPLAKIAARTYLKKKKEEGWMHFTIHWPEDYPQAFKDAIEDGGVWVDFMECWSDYTGESRAKEIESKLTAVLKGLVAAHGKYTGRYSDDEFNGNVEAVTYNRGPIKRKIRGILKIGDYIYSINSWNAAPAPSNGRLIGVNTELAHILLEDKGFRKDVPQPFKEYYYDSQINIPKKYQPILTYEKPKKTFGREMYEMYATISYREMDRAIRSNEELAWDTVADVLELIFIFAGGPLSAAAGPLIGVALELIESIPDFIRAINADTEDEKKTALFSLITGLAIGLIGEAASDIISRVSKLSKRLSDRIGMHAATGKLAPVIKLEDLEDWAEGIADMARRGSDGTDTNLDKILKKGDVVENLGEIKSSINSGLVTKIYQLQGIDEILNYPSEKCAVATQKIFNLTQAEHPEAEVVQLLFWRSPSDSIPTNHFAVKFKNQGEYYIVDATIGQFDDIPGVKRRTIYLGSESEWLDKLKSAHINNVIKLQKDNTTAILNKPVITLATTTPGILVSEVPWYRMASAPSQLLLNAKADLTVRPWFGKSSVLKERLSSKRVKGLLRQVVEQKSTESMLNSIGLSRKISRGVRERTKNETLKRFLGLNQLAAHDIEVQIDDLKAINDQVDIELRKLSMVDGGRNYTYVDNLLALKIDVDIRISELEIHMADSKTNALGISATPPDASRREARGPEQGSNRDGANAGSAEQRINERRGPVLPPAPPPPPPMVCKKSLKLRDLRYMNSRAGITATTHLSR